MAPLKSRGAAQLALTGDDEFLRIARLAAARQGLHLDEYGLWRWHEPHSLAAADDKSGSDGDGEVGAGYWELVEGENEARILDEIGLGFIPPARRNFRFLAGRNRASARAGTLDLSTDPFVEAAKKRSRPSKSPSGSALPVDHSGGSLDASPEDDVQEVDKVWVGRAEKA